MDDLRTRYEAWERARNRYSAQEETGPLPTSNEWQWSDDEAVDLLHEAMQALATTNTLLHGQREITNSLDDIIGSLTTHADTMRRLLEDLERVGVTDCLKDQSAVQRAIDAYDKYIREA